MLDHQKSYQRFLAAMKLLRIPVHTPSIKTDSQTAGQSAAVATDTSNQVEIDMRYYNHLVHSIPDESISVPLVLHCLVEQVVATVDETNPLAKQTETREDGLDNDLAAHINSKMADLALSSVEKQEILETDNVNKRREDAKVPVILEHNDKLSQRLHYLEDLSILDGLDTERTMLDTAAPRALDIFPRRTVTEFMESSARFHQFIQHCSFPSAENVSYLLKKYTFEGIPLKSVEATGNIVEPQQLDKKFSSYNNPWDDPYSDFSKYFNARDQGMINDDVKDLGSVSAAVRLVSFRNLDDWCYVEEFDRTTFTQVLDDARHSHPFVDTYYHKHDDTLLLVYHNPVGKQLQNTSRWNVRLLSDVGFRNYLEHISCMIHDWNLQQERIEEENNKTPTPVPPTPEPPQTEIKIGSRYGLKTRAEIAALKAEEEDKGKKKGKRSARSRTPKSGKKSAGEKKGSPSKNRTTSAATKGSKARLVHEVETQPEVDDQGAMDADVEYDFLGYDVGDDLIHVTGVQSSMFPCDGGEIRVEKTQYVRGPNFVSTSVHKDGNILKLHFLEPQEEILPEQPSNISVDSKAENTESREKTEEDVAGLNEPNDEGVEKSEFEANEKTASFHEDVVVESDKIPSEPDPPVFCTHASFVAQLNDGMVITCSGFGAHGKPGQQGEGADGEFGTVSVHGSQRQKF
ncbi:Hypothetical predicted protein [Paramuricea clavata]|uniref:Uncharacterized protein n=2 Tax=Paramuricea clavata TaxID=317549 RepID=A0A7D9KY69_PARCT|nr:Hypothetical predicted protein [Paramuricea clavata]